LSGNHYIGKGDALVAHIKAGTQIIGLILQGINVFQRRFQQGAKILLHLIVGRRSAGSPRFKAQGIHLLE